MGAERGGIYRGGLKAAFYRLITETAEAPLPPPLSQPAPSRPLSLPLYHHQTSSAGDKDTQERNEEKDKPKK